MSGRWYLVNTTKCKWRYIICIYICYIYMCICTLVKCIASYQTDMHGDRIIGVIVTDIFINQGISLRFNLFQQSAVKPCTAVTSSENSCFMQKMAQGSCFFYVKCVNWYFDAKSLFFQILEAELRTLRLLTTPCSLTSTSPSSKTMCETEILDWRMMQIQQTLISEGLGWPSLSWVWLRVHVLVGLRWVWQIGVATSPMGGRSGNTEKNLNQTQGTWSC